MPNVRKISDESGQMIVLTAMSMVVLIAFLGFAIDVGHFRYVKRNLQSAADAAALAGALEVRICGNECNDGERILRGHSAYELQRIAGQRRYVDPE
jgi:uncharacterized membrane protein